MNSQNVSEQVKMLNGWTFVEPVEEAAEVGGIILPQTKDEVTQKGKIINTSGGDINLKVGDYVLYRRKAGYKDIELDDKKLKVMRQNMVLGILFGEKATDVAPTKDNVFMEWEEAKSTYGSTAIIRPNSYRPMHFTGTVKAIGPDVQDIAVGDRVFFDQFCGVEKFQEDGKRYAFVKSDDVYCNGVPAREEVVV